MGILFFCNNNIAFGDHFSHWPCFMIIIHIHVWFSLRIRCAFCAYLVDSSLSAAIVVAFVSMGM